LGLHITASREREHLFFSIGNQPVGVHRERIFIPQETEIARLSGGSGHLRHRNRFKGPLDERKRIAVFHVCGHRIQGAHEHFFRAAAGRDDPDADLDQPDISLCRRAHAVRVQNHFAAAAEDHLKRSDHDRLG
jgi:hypothetical protein